MGSIHFPANPRANNVYTLNKQTWVYDGMSWDGRDTGKGNPCPLDSLSATANVAYGCRLLTQTYYGKPLVMIRRASDNSNTIFYAVNGVQGNIASWLTGTTGYVVVWYDQSGSGLNLNAIQASYNHQPRWNVSCQNGQSAMDFVIANNMWLASNTSSAIFAGNTSNFSAYVNGFFNGAQSYGNIFGNSTGGGDFGWAIIVNPPNDLGVYVNNTIKGGSLNMTDGQWRCLMLTYNISSGTFSYYGTATAYGTSTGVSQVNTPPGTLISLGSDASTIGTEYSINGSIGEAIIFSANASNPLSTTDFSQIYSSSLYYWGAN